MEIYLTHDQSTRRITDILLNWSWSGDKSTLVRQLVAEIVFDESTGLPVPQMGDAVMMTDDSGNPIFDGVVLRRSAGSEETSMSFTCFDRGIYCRMRRQKASPVRSAPTMRSLLCRCRRPA